MRSLLLFILTITLICSSADEAHSRNRARSYERWVKAHALTKVERAGFGTIRKWANTHDRELRYDPRLSRVARALLPTLDPGNPGSISHQTARLYTYQWGITDGQLATVVVQIPRGQSLHSALNAELNREVNRLDVNRVGLAIKTSRQERTVIVLFTRREIQLSLVPAQIAPQRTITLRGRILGEHATRTQLTMAVGMTDGRVIRKQIPQSRGKFTYRFRSEKGRGIIDVQLLTDRGRGPQIATQFPIGIGTTPWIRPSSSTEDLELQHEEGHPPDQALTSLILGIRQAHGMRLPAHSQLLADIAREHANDMRNNDFFAHVSAKTGDLTDRLAQHQAPYTKAFENIAIGSSMEEVIYQWLASPSHRANLLAPDINTFGVGVVKRDASPGAPLYAVVVFTGTPEKASDEELKTHTFKKLNRVRRQLGLSSFNRDPRLDELARRHSKEIAAHGQVSDNNPLRGNLIDTVFESADIVETAVDVYRSASINVVQQSPHLREDFYRAGIGIYQGDSPSQGQIWITVIYAND